MRWLLKIDTKRVEIIYEGNMEKQKYYVSIDGFKNEIEIKEDLRDKKYIMIPYDCKLNVDDLDAHLMMNEESVVLVVEGIDVEKMTKYILEHEFRKVDITIWALLLLWLIIMGLGIYFGIRGLIISVPSTLIYLSIIYLRYYKSSKMKRRKDTTWVKDKQGRIIDFKLNELEKLKF